MHQCFGPTLLLTFLLDSRNASDTSYTHSCYANGQLSFSLRQRASIIACTMTIPMGFFRHSEPEHSLATSVSLWHPAAPPFHESRRVLWPNRTPLLRATMHCGLYASSGGKCSWGHKLNRKQQKENIPRRTPNNRLQVATIVISKKYKPAGFRSRYGVQRAYPSECRIKRLETV